MDFTREPIIETVITPREGNKLVVRSSKGTSQEEYFVDAVEVVTFGRAIFFRSTEKPKAFLVPASDYEVLEVRETRIVLKNVGLDRSIKIGGGREAAVKPSKEEGEEKTEGAELQPAAQEKSDYRLERKKDRRRQSRRKRGRDEGFASSEQIDPYKLELEEKIDIPAPIAGTEGKEISETISSTGSLLSHLLSPPPLISETIALYKEKFKEAFYTKEEQEAAISLDQPESQLSSATEIPLDQPEFGSFEISEEDEEEIFRQRKKRFIQEESAVEQPEDTTPLGSSEENLSKENPT